MALSKKQVKKLPQKQRLLWVDAVRGLAIVLMIIFHFCYDLRYFGYVNWSIPNGDGWWQFRYVILTLFIFTVGISLSLAHQQQFRRRAFIKRLSQLVLAALVITIMSLFVFPHAWIYFGILHFIVLASVIGIFFVRRPTAALVIGLIILVSYWLGWLSTDYPFRWFAQWLPRQTEDFVPLIPWLGVMLMGVGVAGRLSLHRFDVPGNRLTHLLSMLGRHGLLVYLIHQPILFSGFYIVAFLFTGS